MSVLTGVKHLSIATGMYGPARALYRRLRPSRLRAFRDAIAFYRALLAPGALCFDVGANIGEKSEALLRAGARVVAIEPNPAVIPELRARCDHQERWFLISSAVGSRPGIATLYQRAAHGQSSLVKEWQGRHVGACPVPVITLDDVIAHFGLPAYCKIDVEGWELEVLQGLSRPVSLLSLEFHLDDRGIAKTSACLERLAEFGPARVNFTISENHRFRLAEWLGLEEFLRRFPDELQAVCPGHHYGDIFVRCGAD